MKHSQTYTFSRSAALSLVASIAFALLTLACFQLGLDLATTAFLYLIIIVLLSLQGSFLLSAVFSLIAVGCLAYYFAPPIFSFQVGDPLNAVAIIAFLITAAVITRLVSRVRKSADTLRRSEEQWRDVFENNPTMYFMVDAAGTVVAVNPFGAAQIGYNVDELVGQPVLSVFYEADREAVQRNVALCLEQLGRAKSWEARKVRKDGMVLWVRETAKAVARVNGPILLVACEDITEKKHAEEALQNAQVELAHITRVMTMGELTASIAHEINQPLAAVVTNANACLRWLAGPIPNLDEAREAVGRIVRDGRRASDVIGRIRALVKKGDTEKTPLDINEAIQEVVSLTHSEIQKSGVVLKMNLAGRLPRILGDRIQLQQVILNLVMNGIEAMNTVTDRPPDLLIRSCQYETDKVLVAVQDFGNGVDRENLKKIFDAFYTTKPQGMGMGLAISRSIVENHGGRLWAVANEGPGATFQFHACRLVVSKKGS